MIASAEIREKVIAVLQDELPLDDFQDWLAQHSWNMHQDSPADAQDLASSVELRLFEYSAEHISERELRSELQGLLDAIVISVQAFLPVQSFAPVRLSAYAANAYLAPSRAAVRVQA